MGPSVGRGSSVVRRARVKRSVIASPPAYKLAGMPRKSKSAVTPANDIAGSFPVPPPIEPMLAKLADSLPSGDTFLYEPKWDGFRAIVFRGAVGEVFIQSRDLRPLDRYFPELHEVFLASLPDGCVIDGEIVMPTPHGLDFDGLQMRLHPAASRVEKLSRETPASFVAFDLLAAERQNLMAASQRERRQHLEVLLSTIKPPIHLTPMTRDRDLAAEWLQRFEGAGLDGVIVKAGGRDLSTGQARDGQSEACAHCRMRRCRLSLAQGREGHRRFAPARSL